MKYIIPSKKEWRCWFCIRNEEWIYQKKVNSGPAVVPVAINCYNIQWDSVFDQVNNSLQCLIWRYSTAQIVKLKGQQPGVTQMAGSGMLPTSTKELAPQQCQRCCLVQLDTYIPRSSRKDKSIRQWNISRPWHNTPPTIINLLAIMNVCDNTK